MRNSKQMYRLEPNKLEILEHTKPPADMDSSEWTEHLHQEIIEAHKDWVNANRFFDTAIGKDQVDYAIYAVITAEKRYEMLLRVAKRTGKNWPEWRRVSQ